MDALYKGRVDLPAAGRSHVLDGFQSAKHHPVFDADEAPPAHGFDDLGREEPRLRHPAGRRVWPCGLTACGLPPLSIVRQQRRHVRAKTVRQEEGDPVGPSHLSDLMDDVLCHRQCALPDVDGQQQLGDRVQRYPHPLG